MVGWPEHSSISPVQDVIVDQGGSHVLMTQQLLHGPDFIVRRSGWAASSVSVHYREKDPIELQQQQAPNDTSNTNPATQRHPRPHNQDGGDGYRQKN